MIHDFATAARHERWPPGRRDAEAKSFGSTFNPQTIKCSSRPVELATNPSKEGSKQTSNGRSRLFLVVLLLASLALFFTQKLFLSSDPQLDQQPDAAAKKEYVESVLLDSENFAEHGDGTGQGVSEEYIDESAISRESDRSQTQTVEVVSVQAKRPAVTPQLNAPANEQAESAVGQADSGYEFYDSLKKGSWPVPIDKGVYVDGELAERDKPVYKLQAASFRSQDDAYRFVNKLKQKSLETTVSQSVSSNGVYWYQVSVGPFVNMSKLNKAQDILVSMNVMPLKRRIN